jgi:tetratricopeptide (TPR) repeat protein
MTKSSGRAALIAAAAIGAVALPSAAFAVGSGMGGSMGPGAGASPSFTEPTYDPVVEYRSGVAALQAGKFRDAERNFDHVLDVTPNDASALFMLGMAKAGHGDLKGAERAYEKTIKVDSTRIDAHRELAVTLAKEGQADKAQAELDALKKQSDACGGSCPEADDLKAAIATVEAALAPKTAAYARPPSLLLASEADGDRAYVQAVRLINQHRYDEALAQLRQAQAVFGPHPDVLTYIGYTYRKMGQYDKAESYYRQALAIAPAHIGATEYYGELMVERGDLAGAKKMLIKIEDQCSFSCVEAEDLRRWITSGPPQGS